MKKKVTLIAALVLIIAVLTVGGTAAFFTSQGAAHNVITTGGISIELNEYGEDGEPFEDIMGAMPGIAYTKDVRVKNTCENSAWVRLKVECACEVQGGEKWLSLNYNTADWTDGKDGFWYYNKPLAAGEETPALFDTVTFSGSMGNDCQGTEFTINVTAYAVQTANNGKSVSEAQGWPTEK